MYLVLHLTPYTNRCFLNVDLEGHCIEIIGLKSIVLRTVDSSCFEEFIYFATFRSLTLSLDWNLVIMLQKFHILRFFKE
jgi:hypothetical protein